MRGERPGGDDSKYAVTPPPLRSSETGTANLEIPMPTQYLLDPAWYAERDRLNSLTRLYDPGTMALVERLDLRPGARCAEIGAGTGSVAELLARHVGPGGQVLAVDTDTRFLDPLADAVITVARQDVTATPLPRGQFDLIHAPVRRRAGRRSAGRPRGPSSGSRSRSPCRRSPRSWCAPPRY